MMRKMTASSEGEELPRQLSAPERAALERLMADPSTPPRRVVRAQIVLEAATGATNGRVAARTGVSVPTVALWRKRYAALGIEGLSDRPRSGRPQTLGPSTAWPDRTFGSNGSPPGDQGVEHLLEAAARTIAQRGFAATRMADIADAAGVSPATVHYHFKVKEEILVQSLLWAHERLIQQLEYGISDTRDPLARVAMLIERTVPYPGVQRDEYLLEIDLWSQVRAHRQLLPEWERYEALWMAHVTAMIEAGITSGDFRSDTNATEVAELLVALTDGLAAQSAIGSDRMPPERVRDLVLRFAAEQLGVDLAELTEAARLPELSRTGHA